MQTNQSEPAASQCHFCFSTLRASTKTSSILCVSNYWSQFSPSRTILNISKENHPCSDTKSGIRKRENPFRTLRLFLFLHSFDFFVLRFPPFSETHRKKKNKETDFFRPSSTSSSLCGKTYSCESNGTWRQARCGIQRLPRLPNCG